MRCKIEGGAVGGKRQRPRVPCVDRDPRALEPVRCDDVDIPGAGRKPEHPPEREPLPARAAVVRGIEKTAPQDESETVEPVGKTKLGSRS